jgi:spore coat protein CotF
LPRGENSEAFGKYETNIKFECSNAQNGKNKNTKFDNNNASNRIVTLSGVTVLGFCH